MAGFNDPLTLALLGAGSGFLDPRGGMLGGFHGAMQGLQAGYGMQDREEERKLKQQDALQRIQAQDFLQKHQQEGTDPRTLIPQMVLSGNQHLANLAATMQKSLPTVKSTVKSFDPQGNAIYHNVMSTGEMIPTNSQVAEQAMQVNLGDRMQFVDPYRPNVQRGAPMAMGINPGQAASLAQSAAHHADSMGMQRNAQQIAQNNADFNRQLQLMKLDPEYQSKLSEMKASGGEAGKLKAAAMVGLPDSIGVLAESLNLSDDLKTHPALENMVGSLPTRLLGQASAIYGGNKEADFAAKMEQAQGKQFLSAIQYMSGFGQLTEVEGNKMQSSAAAMTTAQSPEAFKKAQDDYQSALLSGVRKISAKLGMPESQIMQMLNDERKALKGNTAPVANQKKSTISRGGFSAVRND